MACKQWGFTQMLRKMCCENWREKNGIAKGRIGAGDSVSERQKSDILFHVTFHVSMLVNKRLWESIQLRNEVWDRERGASGNEEAGSAKGQMWFGSGKKAIEVG